MEITKQLSDTQFEIEIEPQPDLVKETRTHIVVAHDYVNFFKNGFIYTKLGTPSMKGPLASCSNVIKVPMNVQIPISLVVDCVLPMLNSHEYCNNAHSDRYRYSSSAMTYWKDNHLMISFQTKSGPYTMPYSLYCELTGIENTVDNHNVAED